jgi:hypothetical protein
MIAVEVHMPRRTKQGSSFRSGVSIYALLLVLALFTLSVIPALTLLESGRRLEETASSLMDASLIASSMLEDFICFGIQAGSEKMATPPLAEALSKEIQAVSASRALADLSPGQKQRFLRYSCRLSIEELPDLSKSSRLKLVTAHVFWEEESRRKEFALKTLALLDEKGRSLF